MSMIDKLIDLKIEDNKSKYDKYRKKDDKKDKINDLFKNIKTSQSKFIF